MNTTTAITPGIPDDINTNPAYGPEPYLAAAIARCVDRIVRYVRDRTERSEFASAKAQARSIAAWATAQAEASC